MKHEVVETLYLFFIKIDDNVCGFLCTPIKVSCDDISVAISLSFYDLEFKMSISINKKYALFSGDFVRSM